jgi:hypothetical protein
MKKAFIFLALFFGLLVISSCMLTSCRSKKLITDIEKHDSISNSTSVIRFANTLDRSLAIKDDFRYTFPTIATGATTIKDCDSLCNQRVIEALASVNTFKSSGNNSYKLYYDKFNNQIVLTTSLGETVSKQKDSIAVLQKSLLDTKSTIKEIPVQFIPTWIKYLAAFGALSIVYFGTKAVLFLQSKIPV